MPLITADFKPEWMVATEVVQNNNLTVTRESEYFHSCVFGWKMKRQFAGREGRFTRLRLITLAVRPLKQRGKPPFPTCEFQ